MKNLTILIFILFLCPYSILSAQKRIERNTQELFEKIESSDDDAKINAYLDLLNYLVKTKPAMVVEISEKGIDLAKKLNDQSAVAQMILARGFAATKLHEPILAGQYNQEAYRIAAEIADTITMCKALIRIGAAKIIKEGIHLAIEDFITVENIALKINNKQLLADAINYLGISYYLLDNNEETIRFSEKALIISEQINYAEGKALANEHLAIVKIKQENFEEALIHNTIAFKLREELDDLPSLAGVYYNFAIISSRLENLKEAIEYTKKSIELRISFGNIKGVGSNYLSLGNIYLRANQPDSALVYLKLAYDIKVGSGDTRTFTSIVKSLADVYEKKNDFKNAHKYLRDYKNYSDSLFSEESRRLSSKILAQQDLVRKENEIEYLQNVNSFNQKLQIYLIIIVVLSTLLAGAFIVLYLINRKSNIKLSNTNVELITLNKDREKFFSIISHDLRSPFHPIIGYSDIVINDINKLSRDEIKDYVTNIHISGKKIYDLLDNLLQWVGLNTGKMKFKPLHFDLNEELDDTLKLFSNNINSKSIKLYNNLEKNTFVYADQSMVGIILRNIISNAIKFSEENGAVNISAKETDNFIEVSVFDYGIGITSEQMASIFTTEMQSTKGTMNESGTGLGLLLSKEMAERNGGTFIIESEVNVGTTVRFTLPVSGKKVFSKNERMAELRKK
ncbi:MAG: tetratricopeptide repeat-containing sensor histidine kinase [Ignavibacteriaceae bacterium]